ncbi:hypothetical protein C8R43DRAFT_1241706 [Mycena crocata]|nr:hypothetical protein C8R43DRAFT_1241706 [Mycena crocata]
MKFISAATVLAALSFAAVSSGAPSTSGEVATVRAAVTPAGENVDIIFYVVLVVVNGTETRFPVSCKPNQCINLSGLLLALVRAGGCTIDSPVGYLCTFQVESCKGPGSSSTTACAQCTPVHGGLEGEDATMASLD